MVGGRSTVILEYPAFLYDVTVCTEKGPFSIHSAKVETHEKSGME